MNFVIFNLRNKTAAIVAALSICFFCLLAATHWTLKRNMFKNNKFANSCSVDFQVIDKDVAFAYSAYIDDRPTRDTGSSEVPIIRIFTYFVRTIDVTNSWQCILWYKDRANAITTSVRGVTNLNEYVQPRYMTAMVLCNMPDDLSIQTPHAISLSPKSTQTPTNYICIEDLRLRRRKQLQDGMRQDLVSREGYVNFTVCTTPLYSDFYKPHHIVNFIEVNRILGAQKFIFYIDSNTDFLIKRCLESYTQLGIVEVKQFTPPVLESLHYHGQIVSISECVYRTMYRTKYLINTDLDEVIVPKDANNWSQLIENIKRNTNKDKQIAAYMFQNQFFPYQEEHDSVFANDTLVRKYAITTLLQTLKENYLHDYEIRSKVMACPDRILIWHVHSILKENLVNKEDVICKVNNKDAVLHHYRYWTTSANLTRERRMHSFASELIENIHFGMGRCMPLF